MEKKWYGRAGGFRNRGENGSRNPNDPNDLNDPSEVIESMKGALP